MSRDTDFIIADEEPEPFPEFGGTAPEPSQPTSSRPSAPKQDTSRGLPWTPKVDLSSTFTPFVTSSEFQQNNTIRERQYSGGDTLDEPVWHTLKRDLAQIGRRLAIVVWPAQLQKMAQEQQARLVDMAAQKGIHLPSLVMHAVRPVSEDYGGDSHNETQVLLESVVSLDWDLWGPLLFSLAYSVTMGAAAPNKQTNVVFSGTFSFIWIFYLVVGINIQLLGGSISFLSAISATGYLIFPIVLGAVLSTLLIPWRLARLLLMLMLMIWSVYAASMSLKCLGVLPGRILLALYPVILMYATLSWLAVIT